MHKIICGTCKGIKKVYGMGMMEKTCTACFGIGYIDKEPDNEDIQKRAGEEEAREGLSDDRQKTPGKRGRRKQEEEHAT